MKLIGSFLIVTMLAAQLFAQTDAARTKHFNIKKGIALEGYDPVSYFKGKPLEGKDEIKFAYRNITYKFISQTNLQAFKINPDKYEPAYGGWCAFAMGETGEKVKIDPETYKILEGKLYVFYNFWTSNTLTDWNKNEKNLQGMGDRYWKKIIQ